MNRTSTSPSRRASRLPASFIASVLMLCAASMSHAQMSGAYTIDAAQPTGGTNYQSFTAAVAALAANTITGDVVFSVAAGTYNEMFTIPVLSYSGAPYWNVTFDGGTGNAATRVIEFAVTTAYGAIVTLNGADHVTLKNLAIRSTGSTYGICVRFMNSADANEISDCRIEVPVTSTSAYHIGISASSTWSTSDYGDHGSDNQIRKNVIIGGYWGIRWNGSSMSDYTVSRGNSFINNEISQFYYYGIHTGNAGAIIVRGNNIVQRSGTNFGYGIYALAANDGSEISYNSIQTHNFGIYCASLNTAFDTSNPNYRARIFNNMLLVTSSSSVYGLYAYNPRHADIMYNSVRLESSAGSLYAFYASTGSSSSIGSRVLNNIFSMNGGGLKYGIYTNYASAFDAFDHNLYQMLGTQTNVRFYWDLQTYNNLDTLKTAVPTFHQNSFVGDPMWVSQFDLHSTSPAVKGAGTPISWISDDIDGDPRATPPCVGADEFSLCSLTCPENIVKASDPGICGAVVSFTVQSATGCGTITSNPPSGSVFPIGTTTVTYASEAGPSCSFTVTVNDVEAPVITAANIAVSTSPGACEQVVSYEPTASDNCPGVSAVTCNPPSGSSFPKGTTVVHCTATDANGNSTSSSFTVTVSDTEAPILTAAPAASLWPPNLQYATFTIADMIASVSDNCETLLTGDVSILVAECDEIAMGPGAGGGSATPEIVIAPDCKSVALRRRREGSGDGRVYSITLGVSDASGNSSTAVFKACLPVIAGNECTEGTPVFSVSGGCGVPKDMVAANQETGFTLSQNFPNPFNPSTTIEFSLRSRAHTVLRVFDAFGRLVATLADGMYEAGSHRSMFDAAALRSGLYFSRLEADGHVLQRSMLLVK